MAVGENDPSGMKITQVASNQTGSIFQQAEKGRTSYKDFAKRSCMHRY